MSNAFDSRNFCRQCSFVCRLAFALNGIANGDGIIVYLFKTEREREGAIHNSIHFYQVQSRQRTNFFEGGGGVISSYSFS